MSRSTISTFKVFEMFPDAETARVYLESRLWPNGPVCPVCNSGERITTRKAGFYRCNACGSEDFTVRTSTIMERSHVSLQGWIVAMWMVAQDPSTPVIQLAETLKVTVKTAGLLVERIYEAAGDLLSELHIAMDETQYRLIAGYPAYRVGRDGSIWTRWRPGKGGRLGFTWRLLNPAGDRQGYRRVLLYANARHVSMKVATLVCTAFHGPRPSGLVCRHKDGNNTNDAAANLAWGTSLENSADTVGHGTAPRGEQNPNVKLTDLQIAEICALKGTLPQWRIALQFGVTQSHVSRLHRGVQRRLTYKRSVAR